MNVVYLLMPNGWHDLDNMLVFFTSEDARKASIKYYPFKIDIFNKKTNMFYGYEPTYTYYQNGFIGICDYEELAPGAYIYLPPMI